MDLTDIPEMLEELKSGALDDEFVVFRLIEMIADHEVQAISDALPEALRDRFRAALCETFGTHGPPEQILLLNSATGDHPEKLTIVDKARSWLQAKGLMSYGVYSPREKAPRSFQKASPDFYARHFPPKAVAGSQSELIRRCAALEREAYALAEERNDLAVLLYQQASALQMRVAEQAPEHLDRERKNEITRSVRLIHAYDLQLSSGDVLQALTLMESAHGDLTALRDFAQFSGRREEALFHNAQLERALQAESWELAEQAAATAWGRTSPEHILWPLFQLAEHTARHEEAREILQRLVISYPQNESWHIRYLSLQE